MGDGLDRVGLAQFVFGPNIVNFFGEIDHERLLGLVSQRVSDRRVLKLLRLWLQAGAGGPGVVSIPP